MKLSHLLEYLEDSFSKSRYDGGKEGSRIFCFRFFFSSQQMMLPHLLKGIGYHCRAFQQWMMEIVKCCIRFSKQVQNSRLRWQRYLAVLERIKQMMLPHLLGRTNYANHACQDTGFRGYVRNPMHAGSRIIQCWFLMKKATGMTSFLDYKISFDWKDDE